MALRLKKIRQLGQGAFGDVWLVQRAGRFVAVKFLRVADPSQLERFAREARLLIEQLKNRHVVDLIDHNLAAKKPYLVMEYCEGGSLRAWVENLRPWRNATIVLLHAIYGVSGIHRLGGFHRDIKPENLLLATDLDGKVLVKVADFGLARVPSADTNMTVSPAGTPGYIAPEVLSGGDFTEKADVYSLGVVGIELITGTRDVAALAMASVPDELKRALRQMVAQRPKDRPTVFAADTALRAVLNPSAHAVATAPAAAASSTSTSGWHVLGALAAAILGAIAIAGKSSTR